MLLFFWWEFNWYYNDKIGKVMRIPKSQRKGKTGMIGNGILTTHERLLWRENKELTASPKRETVQQLYVKHVMSPLLGSKHVDPGVCIFWSFGCLAFSTAFGFLVFWIRQMRALVTKDFLKSVEKNVTRYRPVWRVDSSEVDASRDSVLILSDHSIFLSGNFAFSWI